MPSITGCISPASKIAPPSPIHIACKPCQTPLQLYGKRTYVCLNRACPAASGGNIRCPRCGSAELVHQASDRMLCGECHQTVPVDEPEIGI